MYARSILTVSCVLLVASTALTADDGYKVETIGQQPPDAVSEAIRGAVGQTGLRVLTPGGETLYDIWLAKAAEAKPAFKPTSSVKYPFPPGTLVGVARVPEQGGHDFREQVIPGAVYTLRYAQQPQDGNHLGTSAYQDFVALLPADADEDPARLAVSELEEISKESAKGGTHPGILSLQPPGEDPSKSPQVTKKGDYWVLSAPLGGKAGEESVQIRLDLVVVGHAVE